MKHTTSKGSSDSLYLQINLVTIEKYNVADGLNNQFSFRTKI